jgi:hypothetical protein
MRRFSEHAHRKSRKLRVSWDLACTFATSTEEKCGSFANRVHAAQSPAVRFADSPVHVGGGGAGVGTLEHAVSHDFRVGKSPSELDKGAHWAVRIWQK